MDIIVKFLFYSGRFLIEVTTQGLLEACKRSVQMKRGIMDRLDKSLDVTGAHENVLQLLNENMGAMCSSTSDVHLAFISNKHKIEFEKFLRDLEVSMRDQDSLTECTVSQTDIKNSIKHIRVKNILSSLSTTAKVDGEDASVSEGSINLVGGEIIPPLLLNSDTDQVCSTMNNDVEGNRSARSDLTDASYDSHENQLMSQLFDTDAKALASVIVTRSERKMNYFVKNFVDNRKGYSEGYSDSQNLRSRKVRNLLTTNNSKSLIKKILHNKKDANFSSKSMHKLISTINPKHIGSSDVDNSSNSNVPPYQHDNENGGNLLEQNMESFRVFDRRLHDIQIKRKLDEMRNDRIREIHNIKNTEEYSEADKSRQSEKAMKQVIKNLTNNLDATMRQLASNQIRFKAIEKKLKQLEQISRTSSNNNLRDLLSEISSKCHQDHDSEMRLLHDDIKRCELRIIPNKTISDPIVYNIKIDESRFSQLKEDASSKKSEIPVLRKANAKNDSVSLNLRENETINKKKHQTQYVKKSYFHDAKVLSIGKSGKVDLGLGDYKKDILKGPVKNFPKKLTEDETQIIDGAVERTGEGPTVEFLSATTITSEGVMKKLDPDEVETIISPKEAMKILEPKVESLYATENYCQEQSTADDNITDDIGTVDANLAEFAAIEVESDLMPKINVQVVEPVNISEDAISSKMEFETVCNETSECNLDKTESPILSLEELNAIENQQYSNENVLERQDVKVPLNVILIQEKGDTKREHRISYPNISSKAKDKTLASFSTLNLGKYTSIINEAPFEYKESICKRPFKTFHLSTSNDYDYTFKKAQDHIMNAEDMKKNRFKQDSDKVLNKHQIANVDPMSDNKISEVNSYEFQKIHQHFKSLEYSKTYRPISYKGAKSSILVEDTKNAEHTLTDNVVLGSRDTKDVEETLTDNVVLGSQQVIPENCLNYNTNAAEKISINLNELSTESKESTLELKANETAKLDAFESCIRNIIEEAQHSISKNIELVETENVTNVELDEIKYISEETANNIFEDTKQIDEEIDKDYLKEPVNLEVDYNVKSDRGQQTLLTVESSVCAEDKYNKICHLLESIKDTIQTHKSRVERTIKNYEEIFLQNRIDVYLQERKRITDVSFGHNVVDHLNNRHSSFDIDVSGLDHFKNKLTDLYDPKSETLLINRDNFKTMVSDFMECQKKNEDFFKRFDKTIANVGRKPKANNDLIHQEKNTYKSFLSEYTKQFSDLEQEINAIAYSTAQEIEDSIKSNDYIEVKDTDIHVDKDLNLVTEEFVQNSVEPSYDFLKMALTKKLPSNNIYTEMLKQNDLPLINTAFYRDNTVFVKKSEQDMMTTSEITSRTETMFAAKKIQSNNNKKLFAKGYEIEKSLFEDQISKLSIETEKNQNNINKSSLLKDASKVPSPISILNNENAEIDKMIEANKKAFAELESNLKVVKLIDPIIQRNTGDRKKSANNNINSDPPSLNQYTDLTKNDERQTNIVTSTSKPILTNDCVIPSNSQQVILNKIKTLLEQQKSANQVRVANKQLSLSKYNGIYDDTFSKKESFIAAKRKGSDKEFGKDKHGALKLHEVKKKEYHTKCNHTNDSNVEDESGKPSAICVTSDINMTLDSTDTNDIKFNNFNLDNSAGDRKDKCKENYLKESITENYMFKKLINSKEDVTDDKEVKYKKDLESEEVVEVKFIPAYENFNKNSKILRLLENQTEFFRQQPMSEFNMTKQTNHKEEPITSHKEEIKIIKASDHSDIQIKPVIGTPILENSKNSIARMVKCLPTITDLKSPRKQEAKLNELLVTDYYKSTIDSPTTLSLKKLDFNGVAQKLCKEISANEYMDKESREKIDEQSENNISSLTVATNVDMGSAEDVTNNCEHLSGHTLCIKKFDFKPQTIKMNDLQGMTFEAPKSPDNPRKDEDDKPKKKKPKKVNEKWNKAKPDKSDSALKHSENDSKKENVVKDEIAKLPAEVHTISSLPFKKFEFKQKARKTFDEFPINDFIDPELKATQNVEEVDADVITADDNENVELKTEEDSEDVEETVKESDPTTLKDVVNEDTLPYTEKSIAAKHSHSTKMKSRFQLPRFINYPLAEDLKFANLEKQINVLYREHQTSEDNKDAQGLKVKPWIPKMQYKPQPVPVLEDKKEVAIPSENSEIADKGIGSRNVINASPESIKLFKTLNILPKKSMWSQHYADKKLLKRLKHIKQLASDKSTSSVEPYVIGKFNSKRDPNAFQASNKTEEAPEKPPKEYKYEVRPVKVGKGFMNITYLVEVEPPKL